MSEINPTNFADGELDISESLYRVFYSAESDTLRVINGKLEADNFVEDPVVTYKNVQRNTFAGGSQVAGTASLDFFGGGSAVPVGSGFFRGSAATNKDRALPVPGACIRFYLPYDSMVLLMWTVTWTNDSNNLSFNSHMTLFIDGEIADGSTMDKTAFARRVRRTMFGGANAVTDDGSRTTITSVTDSSFQDRFKARTWTGHYFTPVPMKAGWHDAGLRVSANSNVKQTRVRARSMKYIYFKYGATK